MTKYKIPNLNDFINLINENWEIIKGFERGKVQVC